MDKNLGKRSVLGCFRVFGGNSKQLTIPRRLAVRRTPAPLRVRDHAEAKKKPGNPGLARDSIWWAVRVSNPGPWD